MAERVALALIGGVVSEIPAGDTIRGAGSSGTSIPQLASDPPSPAVESAWVRETMTSQAGSPIGLLLGITNAVSTYTYELRYRTQQGTTVGVPLT
jgi:hypothetical protein